MNFQMEAFVESMNEMGANGVPFLFVVDFEMKKPWIRSLSSVDATQVMFSIDGFSNVVYPKIDRQAVKLVKHPLSRETYQQKFDIVAQHLQYGDSFLTNLTAVTGIDISLTLRQLFEQSHATYKLLFNDEFLVFSPEPFIRIKDGKIYSYPMKGTIDASVPNAATRILKDVKELAEHVTIVDLIRNDLSQVASEVTVTRFRYLDEIRTNNKTLLQVSSEIVGKLPGDYQSHLGDILAMLLPAGSVSGAPKKRTVEIIHEAEGEDRGYYTGVFGYFDGRKLDSGVMIRYIERRNDKLFYRSGGGITTQSDPEGEYREMIDKVYVPLN